MADLKKIRLSGVTYNLVDESALHNLDSTVTSGGTNPVQGSGIYNAITASTAAALQTVAEAGYQTSGDVQSAISGKVDTDTYTAYTAATDTVLSGKADVADIPAVSGYADAVAYDSGTTTMNFYHGGTGGTVVYSFDASPFLIDGMIDNVEIKDVTISGESVTCLVITFNTDAGKEEIDIPLSDIFDASNYYTKEQTDDAISAATSGLQESLSAGTGIDISNNVISVTGAPLTMDDNVTSGSSNPVKSSGIYSFVTGETATKQDTLVSGTNIKTVGTNSLLGSGNITLMTASVGTGNDAETLILDFA